MSKLNAKKVHSGVVRREYRRHEGKVTIGRKDAKPDFNGYRYTMNHWTKLIRGSEDCTVELFIDYAALFEYMAARAAASKSGVSKWQGGIVYAKVVNRKQNGESVIDNPIDEGWEKLPEREAA